MVISGVKEITTRTAAISIDANEIVLVRMTEGIHLDYEDALDNFLVVRQFSKSKQLLKLIDSRADWTIDDKAKRYMEGKSMRNTTKARAFVVRSQTKKLLLNFYYTLNAPNAPSQVFTDYDEAYAWLLSFKSK